MYSYGFFRQTVEGAMDKQVGFALIAGDPFHKVVINLLTPPLYVHISNGYNGSNTLEKSLTATISEWRSSSKQLRRSMRTFLNTLEGRDFGNE